MSPNHEALARAIKNVEPPTQARLAAIIGTSQALVGYWLNKSKRGVPAEWVGSVSAASGIAAHELRPDLFEPAGRAPARATRTEARV